MKPQKSQFSIKQIANENRRYSRLDNIYHNESATSNCLDMTELMLKNEKRPVLPKN